MLEELGHPYTVIAQINNIQTPNISLMWQFREWSILETNRYLCVKKRTYFSIQNMFEYVEINVVPILLIKLLNTCNYIFYRHDFFVEAYQTCSLYLQNLLFTWNNNIKR